jgi:hypothetical protein
MYAGAENVSAVLNHYECYLFLEINAVFLLKGDVCFSIFARYLPSRRFPGDGGERCSHCIKFSFACTYVEPALVFLDT